MESRCCSQPGAEGGDKRDRWWGGSPHPHRRARHRKGKEWTQGQGNRTRERSAEEREPVISYGFSNMPNLSSSDVTIKWAKKIFGLAVCLKSGLLAANMFWREHRQHVLEEECENTCDKLQLEVTVIQFRHFMGRTHRKNYVGEIFVILRAIQSQGRLYFL